MDEGLKGVLVTLTLASLFVMSMLSFITLFPQEQGIIFTNNADSDRYLVMENITDTEIINTLTTIHNQTEVGFNQWDDTQGFMGSNTIKQTSGTGITSYAKNLFSTLTVIATELFGSNSPVVYAMGVFSVLAGAYIIYLIITFIRTGR